ncbi:hypothetical protein TRIP_C60270 [Candidatus Zixiibacteriota bacterium]|nr:hypothetical protein TRIP_C60270 [candidate division Zixibacteria bacterium]
MIIIFNYHFNIYDKQPLLVA